MSDDQTEPTPLQRYLAKQRAEGLIPTSEVQPAPESQSQSSTAPTQSVAPAPTPVPEPIPAFSPGAGLTLYPGSFLGRFVANFLDHFIVWALTFPVILFSGFSLWFNPFSSLLSSSPFSFSNLIVTNQLIALVYFGWFYSARGATPGKMAMGLKLIDRVSGRNVGFFRSYLREEVGKPISGLFLFFGFLIALLNKEALAFHDLLFLTRVIVAPPRPSPI